MRNRRFPSDKRGAAALDYALLAAIVIIALVAGSASLAPTIAALYQRIVDLASAAL